MRGWNAFDDNAGTIARDSDHKNQISRVLTNAATVNECGRCLTPPAPPDTEIARQGIRQVPVLGTQRDLAAVRNSPARE